MIKLELSVREAMILAVDSSLGRLTDNNALYEKIVDAFEKTLAIDTSDNRKRTVTITGGLNLDNRIRCIKHIRHFTGWDLKKAKEWTDVFTGCWKNDRWTDPSGYDNSITLKYSCDAENLLRELTALGCEGFLS